MFKTKGPARAERRLQGWKNVSKHSQLSGMGTDENGLVGLFVNVYILCLYNVHYLYVFMYVICIHI